jgi:iron complex outermembrane receptor protein
MLRKNGVDAWRALSRFPWRLGLGIALCLLLFAPAASAAEGQTADEEHKPSMLALNEESGSGASEDENEKTAESKSVLGVGEVTVTGSKEDEATADIPAVIETMTKEDIEKINATDSSDVFKYVPNVHIRKLNAGNINRPMAIRGSTSTTAAPRTLVLMDGIPISNYVNGSMSDAPKWQMVSPEEMESIDVIYGPFSAAYGGNSFGGTVLITTHMPQKMEGEVDTAYTYQNYRAYNTDEDIHSFNENASFGDKLGPFSYMFWYDRLDTQGQPTSYQSKLASDGGAAKGTAVTGWTSDSDPLNQKRYILGSYGLDDVSNNTGKIKLAYDLTPDSQLRFNFAMWDSETSRDDPETYLRDASGNPIYSGVVNIDGRSYTLAANTFSYQEVEKQDMLYGLSYSLLPESGLKVKATASYYDTYKDVTRTSSTAPPTAKNGGAGSVTDKDTGTYVGDLKAFYDIAWMGKHTVGAGYHYDRNSLDSEVWDASDWKRDIRTTLSKKEEGTTETHGIFLEDSWDVVDKWTVYLGGRCEWWNGFDGSKSVDGTTGRIKTSLPDKEEATFSPKFSTTFRPTDDWSLRFSMGLATRYPTIGELYYGGISSSGIINNNNPDLKPEEVFAKDFTITRKVGKDGEARLTFFQDDVDNAIFSQTNYYTNITNYQNVDEVRTRGIEIGYGSKRFFADGLGLHASVGWNDSEILRNDNVPSSVGKTFPRVPEWRAKCVVDYAPTDRWYISFGGSYASRAYYYLDNSDDNGGYGGMDEYLVFDARMSYQIHKYVTATLGVDNITDELYYEYHPYPRRTFFAELKLAF